MSEFTFSLNQLGISSAINEARASAPSQSAVTNFESGLSANIKDEDLKPYTGDDYIVWDRVNEERLRRGLPSLTELGYPRPLDAPPTQPTSSVGNNGLPETFKIKGPPGMTYEQAKAVFDQQVNSGGLVGFKVGDTASAATQAAAGLASAQSQLTQGLASLSSKLPAGTNLNSLTASIGALGQGAGTQVASALRGGAAAFNSLTTGASGGTAAISAALSAGLVGVSQRAGASYNTFKNRDFQSIVSSEAGPLSSSAITGALTGAAARAGSLASTTVGTLSGLIKGTPTSGINVADFAKQGPALTGLGSMSLPDVTSTLAQASKLVGQSADTISNAAGAGKFGLDASQLERWGLVKPGTAATFLAQGGNDLTSVLKSPTVWTGRDGVKSLDGLLGNEGLQNKIQQGLMTSGVADLKSLGIPTDKLTPQALSGLATNAAKSVPDTLNWAKNTPGLPADIKSKFDAAAVNGAFAVNLAQTKIDPSMLQEYTPLAAEDTVNTATLEAAAKRIVGNAKVPSILPATIGSSLYSKTPDDKLIYTGNDDIVWDNINDERLRRGLPSLTAIGYPRPDPSPNNGPAQGG